MSLVLLMAISLLAETNFRWKPITFSSASTVTVDTIQTYTSDAFYLGDGNLHPASFGVMLVNDVTSDSVYYTVGLLLSFDGTNYTTTATAVDTLNMTSDTNAITTFTGTSVPFARWGKLTITATLADSTAVVTAQRGAAY